jgi:4-diphosphocytidyl-2C-methyl-D-erythritol kinase
LNSDQLLTHLQNDLEPPAFSLDPKLGQLRKESQDHLQRIVRMSGSGSSLFTLYDQEHPARLAAASLADRFHIRAISVELAPKIRDDLHEDLTTR